MTQPWEDYAQTKVSKPWEDFSSTLKGEEKPEGLVEDFLKPLGKAAVRVPATVIGGLGSSVVGGVAGIGAAATQPIRNILYGTKIDPLTAANTELERWGKKTQYVQTPEEEKSLNYIMKVMKPVEMIGEGWAGLPELVATGDVQKSADVIEGRSAGTTPVSRALAPIAATVGQVSALFGGPKALGKVPIVKNMVRDIIYEKSGLKGAEGAVEAPKVQPPVRPVSDPWLKDRLTEASLQETLRPKGAKLEGTYWDYLDQMEKAQRWSERIRPPETELPSGHIERGVEIPPPKPNELSAFDQMKLEALRNSDPAMWGATDRLFMDRLGEKPLEPLQSAAEKPELFVPEQYAGAKTPERIPEAYRSTGKTFKEPIEQPTPFQEIWEAETETTKKPGFTIKDRRTFKNILEDVNTAAGKKGAIGEWERSPESLAARERLKEDLIKFSEAAKREGKDVAQYLKDTGASDETMLAFARLTRESRKEELNAVNTKAEATDLMSKVAGIKNISVHKGEMKRRGQEIVHGTDIDNLPSILKDGLKAGSAIDTTGDWIGESPVAITLSNPKLGEYVEHNKYYKLKDKASITKVVVDLDQYEYSASNKIKNQVADLAKQYPAIKFIILDNYEGVRKPKYTLDDMVDLDNKIIELYKAPTPEIDVLKAEKAKILEPFKRGEYSYNTTGMKKELRDRLDEINDEVKLLEKRRQREINLLEDKARQAAIDVDEAEGTDFSEDTAAKPTDTSVADRSSYALRQDARSAAGDVSKIDITAEEKAGIGAEKSFLEYAKERGFEQKDLEKDEDALYKLRADYTKEANGFDAEARANAGLAALESKHTAESKQGAFKKLEDKLKSESGSIITAQKKPFYSKLEEFINKDMKLSLPIDSVRKMAYNKGVTIDEWNDVFGHLRGKVTKGQLLDELSVHGRKFKDVVLGEKKTDITEKSRLHNIYMEALDRASANGEAVNINILLEKPYGNLTENQRIAVDTWKKMQERPELETAYDSIIDPLQFEQYSEPGYKPGSSRELFVTAPNSGDLSKVIKDEFSGRWTTVESDSTYLTKEQAANWQDGHQAYSSIQNPIVRIRFNERDVNGKRVLFIEEMQGPSEANQAKMPESLRSRIYDIGVKRVVSYAKENGFDEIAWTTGKMQADRYNLEKYLDEVSAKVQGDYFKISIKDKKGNSYNVDHSVTAEELPEYVGKTLAKRIIKEAPLSPEGVKYTDLDLKVGGEGLKRLYDEVIPGLMEKYGKGKVGKTEIAKDTTVSSLPITEKTPSSFTLYSDPFGAHAAFKASKKALSEISEDTGVKKYTQDAVELADDFFGSISTRLANIDPAIKYRLRRFEFNRESKITKYEKAVLPLIKAAKKMSKADRKAFDTARKNGNAVEVNALAEKYGIQNELATTRQILDELYNEARKVGFNVKRYPEYHPREVTDFTGLMEYLHKTEGWTTIDTAIKAKEQKLQRYLTDQEKAKVVNSMLRGYATEQITLSKPGQLKARVISEITPEIDKFYGSSDSALLRYITDVTDIIEARRLFGKTAKKYEGFDVDNSIGAYVLDLRNKGKLSPAQERELTKILKARFHEVGTHGIVGLYKNASYIDTMGSVMSAITQIGDSAFSIHKYGVGKTTKGIVQTIRGKSVMSREDLGISRRIASEFSDKSRMAKAVDTVFKAVGLTGIDSLFKSAAINAAYNSAVKLARDPKAEVAFRKKLEPIFEKETDAVIEEFKNGEVTENTKLYVFNEIADIQPIALSEMPVKYLTGGNGRIFYMLKTYTLKMFDVYRNDVYNKIKTPEQRTEGIKNLISLTAALVVMNTGADVIKDILFGRPIILEDHVVDNIWRTVGASRYTVEQAKRDGVGTAALKQILPPTKAINAAYKDVKSMGDGKGSELVQSIPIFGKFYYWWFGKGADYSSKKAVKVAKDRYYKMAIEDVAKTGDVSQKTIETVQKDTKLNDKDLDNLWSRIKIGDDHTYKVSRMPFDKALREFSKASTEEKKTLSEILANKYDRLSDSDKEKFDPEISKIIAEEEKKSIVDVNKLIFGKESEQ